MSMCSCEQEKLAQLISSQLTVCRKQKNRAQVCLDTWNRWTWHTAREAWTIYYDVSRVWVLDQCFIMCTCHQNHTRSLHIGELTVWNLDLIRLENWQWDSEFEFEFDSLTARFYALSASKAIFRVRTYNCITYSVRWWWLLDEWN